jgi:hypothetical protein
VGLILDLTGKVKDISVARGITYIGAVEEFHSNLKDYGPLLGFKQSANHYKHKAIEEVKKCIDARKKYAEFEERVKMDTAALNSREQKLLAECEATNQRLNGLQSRVKELAFQAMFYHIPDKLFYFWHVVYNGMPPNVPAMQVLLDGFRRLRQFCPPSSLICNLEDVENLIEAGIIHFRKSR